MYTEPQLNMIWEKIFQQNDIGELVRQAHNLRAEAIQLENDAQEILTKSLDAFMISV